MVREFGPGNRAVTFLLAEIGRFGVGVPLFSKPRISKATWWYVSSVLACTAYLYPNLFLSAKTPFLLGGDQVYFWMGAQRILDGQAAYKDFFQVTPPATDLVYAAFFKVLVRTYG